MTNCKKPLFTLGEIPTSYKASLTYEEQLLCIVKKIEELEQFINNILEQKITDYVQEVFNNVIVKTMYDAGTETLTLYIDEEVEE